MPFDLTRETYTRQLWFFEGFTSYYDDLTLVRSGLIEPLAYLNLIAENIGRVMSRSTMALRFDRSWMDGFSTIRR